LILFVDSGAWIALMRPEDRDHSRAREFFRSLRGTRLLTSNYVLSESYTWMNRYGFHRSAVQLKQMIDSSSNLGLLSTVWVTPDIHGKAWDVFQRYDDQAFSFCDCTTSVLCQANQVDFVFGFDRDFLTMGLDLKPGP